MANVINGTSGADSLTGLSGDNSIIGGAGADKLNGGASFDTLDGGSGNDTLSGNSGDDLLIYKAADNVGATDVYDGGSGSVDTLRLDLTMTEWLRASLQTDLVNYLNFLNINTHWKTLEASNTVFTFSSFNLQVSKIEYVEVYVDGVKLSPENNNVIVAGDNLSATEDAAGPTVNLLANDSVLDQVQTFSSTNPAHGIVAITTDFSAVNNPKAMATYTADATYWNYLAVGETGSDSFTYTVKDADGQTATSTVNVTITGVNDAVSITSGAQAGAVVEDADQTPAPGDSLTASGTITFTDPDLTDVHTRSITTSPANPLGVLTLGAVSEAANTATGSVGWTYTLDNTAAQKLAAGVQVVETYVVTIADAHGSSTTQEVKITITGTNDAPVITPVVVAAGMNETNAGLTANGSVTVADVDVGDTVALTVDSVSRGGTGSSPLSDGQLKGMMTVDADGAWHFNSGGEAFNNLAAGKTLVLSYVIKADDGHAGGTDTETVTITITGTNDAAVIGAPPSADVTEDAAVNGAGQLTATGTLAISDLDDGEAAFQTTVTPAAGALGSLTLAANGAYTYAVSNAAVQNLGAGDTKVDKFTVTALDGTTKEVSFTIHGVNDAAVIGDPTVDDVTEDAGVNGAGHLTAAGTISISDADAGEAAFNTTVTPAAGALGSLTLAADGSYTYAVSNAAVQYLGAGDTKAETFTVTSVDGTAKDVTFTITGVNDAAVIGDPTVDDVTEDLNPVGGNLTAVGTISISDDDAGEASFNTTVTPAAGVLGSLTLAADGSYTYSVANADVQYLGAGDTKVDKFTVAAIDGTTKEISFTVTGVNDAAVIGDPTVDDVTEDLNVIGGNLMAVGAISISDDDAGEASFNTTVTPAAGVLGSLTLAADGSYTYAVANADVQYLGAGDTKTETFTVTALDGTAKDVTFTITGVNDAAVIGDPTVDDVTEDLNPVSGNLTAVGSISISDDDAGEASFNTTVTPAAGVLGSLSLAANGSYTYSVANADVQYLGAGDTKTETFTVTALDGTAKDVSFTITGVNDAAVIGDPTVDDVTEDAGVVGGSLTAVGTISISDDDAGEASFNTTVTPAAGVLGSLTLAANGSYTYSVANADVQYLGAGDTKTETFTVTALDGTAKDVTFTIHGVNDAAVIGDPTVDGVTEDAGVVGGNLTAVGTISISDDDAGQASFNTTVTPAVGTLGSLTLAANGSYIYSVANADVQYLGAGDTKVETFTVSALDGTSKDVTFTIHGVNDAAVIGAPSVAAVTEDVGVVGGNLTAVGTISIGDDDAGEASFSTTVTSALGNLGSLTLAADGSYTYAVANSLTQSLGQGATKVDTFTVTSADGTTKNVSFTINGVNDAPVFTSGTSASTPENVSTATVIYDANVTDVDGAPATFTLTGADAGKFDINAAGEVTFKASPDFEAPGDVGGNNVYDITVNAFDGVDTSTRNVAITVTNVVENSPPTVNADTVILSTGTTPAFFLASALLKNDTDPNNDALTVVGATGAGVSFNAVTGLITLTDPTINSFTYQVSDGINPAVSATVTVQKVTVGSGNEADNVNLSALNYAASYISTVAGNDTATGGGGVDWFVGGSGSDVLVGGATDDVLDGGSQNDMITGGAGNDSLTGGSQTDTFVFASLSDGSDTITDFTEAGGSADLISLSGIDAVPGGGDNAFAFVAAQNAGTVANSVTWQIVGGNTIIRLDTDGVAGAELTITLTGSHNLVAGDFLL